MGERHDEHFSQCIYVEGEKQASYISSQQAIYQANQPYINPASHISSQSASQPAIKPARYQASQPESERQEGRTARKNSQKPKLELHIKGK